MKLLAIALAFAACSSTPSSPADVDTCLADCCADPSAPTWCATRASNCHRADLAAESNCVQAMVGDVPDPGVASCLDGCLP